MMMRKIFKKYYIPILGILIGGLAGFLYWRFIGCTSGSCPIKSVWYWSTLTGMVIGYLLGDSLDNYLKKHNRNG